jgi:hypothetical protein
MLDYLAPNYSGRLLYLNDFELSVHGEKNEDSFPDILFWWMIACDLRLSLRPQ